MDTDKFYSLLQSNNINNPSDIFEAIIEGYYRKSLAAEDVAIDCGAHLGRHTIPLANCVGKNGQIIAIEAIPKLANNLQNLLLKKGLNQVKLKNIAISNKVGFTKFQYVTEASGYSGIKQRKYPARVNTQNIKILNIPTDKLDNIAQGLNVKFIKLDLEGGEFDAIKGASNIIKKSHPSIIMEMGFYNSCYYYNYSKEDFTNFFTEINYELYTLLGERIDSKYWDKKPKVYYGLAIHKEEGKEKLNILRKVSNEVIINNLSV